MRAAVCKTQLVNLLKLRPQAIQFAPFVAADQRVGQVIPDHRKAGGTPLWLHLRDLMWEKGRL